MSVYDTLLKNYPDEEYLREKALREYALFDWQFRNVYFNHMINKDDLMKYLHAFPKAFSWFIDQGFIGKVKQEQESLL